MTKNKILPSLMRGDYMQWVDENKFIPDHVKPLAKQAVSSHFQLLGQTIGNLELTYRRTKDHLTES